MKDLKILYVMDNDGRLHSSQKIIYECKNRNLKKPLEDYFCPDCKEKLIFKNGTTIKTHFSHNSNIPRTCNFNKEQALHILGKEAFFYLKNKYIFMPYLTLNEGEITTIKNNIFNFEKIYKEKNITLIDGSIIRPDIILEDNNGHQLLVEILNKHKVDTNKISKLIYNSLNVLEIDMSYLNENASLDEVVDFLQNHINSKSLLTDSYLIDIFNNKYNICYKNSPYGEKCNCENCYEKLKYNNNYQCKRKLNIKVVDNYNEWFNKNSIEFNNNDISSNYIDYIKLEGIFYKKSLLSDVNDINRLNFIIKHKYELSQNDIKELFLLDNENFWTVMQDDDIKNKFLNKFISINDILYYLEINCLYEKILKNCDYKKEEEYLQLFKEEHSKIYLDVLSNLKNQILIVLNHKKDIAFGFEEKCYKKLLIYIKNNWNEFSSQKLLEEKQDLLKKCNYISYEELDKLILCKENEEKQNIENELTKLFNLNISTLETWEMAIELHNKIKNDIKAINNINIQSDMTNKLLHFKLDSYFQLINKEKELMLNWCKQIQYLEFKNISEHIKTYNYNILKYFDNSLHSIIVEVKELLEKIEFYFNDINFVLLNKTPKSLSNLMKMGLEDSFYRLKKVIHSLEIKLKNILFIEVKLFQNDLNFIENKICKY